MTHVRRPVAPRVGARSRTGAAAFVTVGPDDPDPSVRATLIIPALCGTRPAETVAPNVADIGSRMVPDADGTTESLVTLTIRGRKGGGATDTMSVSEPVGQAVHDAIGDRTRGLLLINAHTGMRMSQHTVRRHMRHTLHSAGINRPGLTPYSLRHTVITPRPGSRSPRARRHRLLAGYRPRLRPRPVFDSRETSRLPPAATPISG